MSEVDAFWLKIWELLATVGFIAVIVGVIIEGVEHFSTKTSEQRRKRIERLGWLILVAGLAAEFWGDNRAKRITDRDNARLNLEAATARQDAGDAIKRATESKERLGVMESTNLVLRTKLAELEIKTRARAITPTQVTNFKLLTERIPKVPIKIVVGPQGSDNEQFAYQLRLMLNQAGFLTPSNSGEFGYNTETAKVIVRDIAEITPSATPPNVVRANMIDANGRPQWWSPWPDLVIVIHGPSQPYVFERSYLDERVGEFFRPIVSEANNKQVTEALYRVFEQIKISPGWMHSTIWVKPGEFEIYIPSVRN